MILILIICVFVSLPIYGQQGKAQYEITQFTTSNGLISNVCHDVVLDDDGFLWVAMDGGLMRFNGNSFRAWGEDVGLDDKTIIHLRKDLSGNLWMHTTTGGVYRLDKGSDQVVYPAFNAELKSLMGSSLGFSRELFVVDSNKNIYLENAGQDRIIQVDSIGKFNFIEGFPGNSGMKILKLNSSQYLYFLFDSRKESDRSQQKLYARNVDPYNKEISIWYNNYSFLVKYNREYGLDGTKYVHALNKDTALVYIYGMISVFDSKRLISQMESPSVLDVKSKGDSGLLIGFKNKGGLRWYESTQDLIEGRFTELLTGYTVTSIQVIDDNSFWVSTLEKGIFYFKEKIFGSLYKDSEVLFLDINSDSLIFAGDANRVFQINRFTKRVKPIYSTRFEIRDILYDKTSGRLVLSAVGSKYYDVELRDSLRPIYRTFEFVDSNGIVKQGKRHFDLKTFKKTSKGEYIALGSEYWARFDQVRQSPIYFSKDQGADKSLRFNDLEFYNNKYLFASDTGIVYFEGNDYHRYDIDPLIDHQRIKQIEVLNEKLVVVSYKGKVFVVDTARSLKAIELGRDIPGSQVNRIVVNDSNDQIYICTDKGLCICQINNDSLQIVYQISTNDGLLSNQVNDVSFSDDTLYIATEAGIEYVNWKYLSRSSNNVFIEYINDTYVKDSDRSFSFQIEYNDDVVIHFDQLQGINDVFNLRKYRINDREWIFTHANEVHLSSLSPGSYVFTVCVQNNSGEWANCDEIRFAKSNLWYYSWQFILLSVIAGFGLIAFYFRSRIYKIKERQSIERQILDLERKALNAQMNPHFIFNLLNSIQSFIYFNEKKVAMKYLSKFARFLRQNLTASSESVITLHEELSLIRNYLELEELGQKGKFTFDVRYESTISPAFMTIPPMLVQPFVENAVKHGMKGVESGGKIEVIYRQVESLLEITIKDNGPGMNEADINKPDSYGIKLTMQRLQLINEKHVPPIRFVRAPGGGAEIHLYVSWTANMGTSKSNLPRIVEN